MAGRWSDPAAFRAAPAATAPQRPSARQSLALIAVLLLVAGTVAAVSYLVRPDRARSFSLFRGSVFLSDALAPVAVDLATGRPTVRLINAAAQVGAKDTGLLAVTPLSDGTLLVNTQTGEFNVVAATGFVVKTAGGVPIAARAGSTGVTSIASGDLGYLVQTAPTGTSVYLVGEPTVETATDVGATVRPRGFRSLPEPSSTAVGSDAAANGNLWLLAGTGTTRRVLELSLPARSSAGATLVRTDRGAVSGVASLESATSATGAVAAVATAGRIEIFPRSGTARTARFSAPAGVDQILPASNAQGRLSWLMHAADGWYAVSIGTGGTGLVGPARLAGLPASAALVAPAASLGELYTMDSATGLLYRIVGGRTLDTISGATAYPVVTQNGRSVEAAGFTAPYVLARGPRVIYNDPDHLDALAVFTDGSHSPVTIQKSAAVSVNASASADALTRSRDQATGTGKSPTTPQQQRTPVDPVNNQVDCKTTQQKPHVPTIVAAVPGSRSVQLSWTYPLLTPQDCAPSTYVVSVQLISASAPSPPGSVRVQGQQGVNLAGLFPSTQYSVTVTAYLNGLGTPSPARLITTGPAGPAAPHDVAATPDSNGNWDITWSSCGTVQNGCVPAASWRVIPQICDGLGLSATPASVSVTADPTSVVQPPAQLQGGDALLGRGLRFQVEGIGDEGSIGEPSGFTPCTYSWAPPAAATMSLHASTRPLTQFGATTSATVTLDLGGDPVRDVGGTGAQVTFSLLSDGGVVRTSTATVTPGTAPTATFTGIAAGQSYSAQAVVAAPRHPASTATIGPVSVDPAIAPWPGIAVTSPSVIDQGAAGATLSFGISGLSSSAARGEKFDLVNSTLTCGSSTMSLQANGFDPANPGSALSDFSVDRITYNGSCSIHVQLAQDPGSETDPSLFGDGTVSNAAGAGVSIDPPTLTGITSSDFSAAWDGSTNGQSQIKITYSGGSPTIFLANNWSATVTDTDGSQCGSYSGAGSLQDVVVPQSCVQADGASGNGWSVTISFSFLGAPQGPYTVSGVGGGSAPTYTPAVCDVAGAGITAGWSGTSAAPQVSVGVADPSKLTNCSGWTLTVVSPATANCGSATSAPPQTIALTCSDTPAENTWSVSIGWTDLNNATQTTTVTVTGSPPQ